MFLIPNDIMNAVLGSIPYHTVNQVLSTTQYTYNLLATTTSVRRMTRTMNLASPRKCPKERKRTSKSVWSYARSSKPYKSRIIIKRALHTPQATVTVMASTHKFPNSQDHSFDTDSYNIGIDNHASYCLTNNLKDFIDTPQKVKVRIKGISGHAISALKGTVC